jgi:hypothetical protein
VIAKKQKNSVFLYVRMIFKKEDRAEKIEYRKESREKLLDVG